MRSLIQGYTQFPGLYCASINSQPSARSCISREIT